MKSIVSLAIAVVLLASCGEEKAAKNSDQAKPELSEEVPEIKATSTSAPSIIYAAGGEEMMQLGANELESLNGESHAKAPYFTDHLRRVLMATQPVKSNDVDEQQFERDKASWDNNLVYGWCIKNGKNIYHDGLKIYTTIDLTMQQHAEWAVAEHLGKELQADFDKNNLKWKNPPFSNDLYPENIEQIMTIAKKRSDRYRNMTAAGASATAIDKAFNTPVQMSVFSWKAGGELDTLMSPMDSIRYYKGFLRASLVSVNPQNGHVKAFVGGANFKHFSYDMAYAGKRQVGSVFKPIVYAAAIDEGIITPCTEFPNIQYCFDMPLGPNTERTKSWCPENAGEKYDGIPTQVRFSLSASMSNITTAVLKEIDVPKVIDMAEKMGVQKNYLEPYPAVSIGVFDLSLFEMVNTYNVFVNKGMYHSPVIVTRIESADGEILYENQPQTRQAMSENTAYAMIDMLKGVVSGVKHPKRKQHVYGGTAMRLRSNAKPYGGIKFPIAGKTGTTQNNADGWFIGMTPDLVTGVWVGGEDRAVRFRTVMLGQGANTALPIWGYYMNKLYNDASVNISTADFEKPANFDESSLKCDD